MQEAEANNADGHRVPGILHNGQAVVADSHPTQSLEPTDGPLDHPADFPQAAAVRRPPLGDVRLDAQPGQYPPRRVAVVAPVGVQRIGQFLGPSGLALDLGKVSTNGMISRWSLRLASAVWMANGTPCRSTYSVCFEPFFPRSTGLGPVCSPPPKARTMTASTITRSGSSLSAFRNSRNRSTCSDPKPHLFPAAE